MSKEYLLKYAKGKENEPDEPLPIFCMYTYDEKTREIKILSHSVLSPECPSIFFYCSTPFEAKPTKEELNRAINEYLENETHIQYVNSNKPDFDINMISSGIPLAHSEDEVDMRPYNCST